jgi:signal transduction histidine kinase
MSQASSKQDEPPDDPASYLKTELLERIAHELRGPAGVTLGALDEIERMLGQSDNEESRALLSMARRGARRVLRTAERLTRTAQLEAGLLPSGTTLLDIREIVARAARDAEQLEGRSAVQVELLTSAQPCVAHVDPNWLGVALGELFSQAIRSARSRVQIQVQSEGGLVNISAHDDRTNTIEVSDTRFLPLRDRRDCALGWPLARDVARAHGGDLAIVEKPATGTGRSLGAVAVLSLKAG